MKKRYAVALIILLACLVVAVFVGNLNKVEYSNFSEARKSDKIVQIIGQPVKNDANISEASALEFNFQLTDKKNETSQVKYRGPKPMNFDLAEYVVVKGKFENGVFIAKEILTKCPSKYEGELNKRKQAAEKK
jgi:cytochrome c-type biogenesis protein CcmE